MTALATRGGLDSFGVRPDVQTLHLQYFRVLKCTGGICAGDANLRNFELKLLQLPAYRSWKTHPVRRP